MASTHHGHYTMASAHSKFVSVSLCIVFDLNNRNVKALIACELLAFTCTCSLTMKWKFPIIDNARAMSALTFLSYSKFYGTKMSRSLFVSVDKSR